MGSLGPNCEDIAVADAIWSVPVEDEGVFGTPLAAHVEDVSTADVEDC